MLLVLDVAEVLAKLDKGSLFLSARREVVDRFIPGEAEAAL